MRYLITFSYDGSKFHGFQRQKDEKSVQKTLEDSLTLLLKKKIEIKGSGRTDSMVHAFNQCAHFDYNHNLNLFKTKKLLNELLDKEIIVKKIKKVSNNFHARFSVKEKKYCYVINFDKNNVNDKYYFTSYKNLNIKAMEEAAKILTGIHDYENFVSGKRENYITYVKKIKIKQRGHYLIFEFIGTSFYRYMVRHLVGALYDIGRNKMKMDELKKLVDKSILKSSSVMPAYGLYLVNIKFNLQNK